MATTTGLANPAASQASDTELAVFIPEIWAQAVRASFKKGWAFDEMNPWFDQWIAILKSKAKSLQEFKKEEWYVRSRKQS